MTWETEVIVWRKCHQPANKQ